MTARELTAITLSAREHARELLGDTAGCCGLVSRWLGYRIAERAVPVSRVIGRYRGANHAWLEVGGLISDPTVEQFDTHAPVVLDADLAACYQPALRLALSSADRDAWTREERERLRDGQGGCYGSAQRDHAALRLLA